MRRKTNNPAVRMAFLIVLCAAVCLVLAVGVTYARYQYDFPRQSYLFTPAARDRVVLCGGGVSQDWIDGGNLPPLPETWEATASGVKLDFGVTNGYVGDFAQRDQSYTIYLAAGLSILEPENLTVTLQWQDGEGQTQQLTATALTIEKGSFLYDTYGEGWIYRFYADDREQNFFLAGGALNYQNFTITVSGAVDPTLLDLQVTGRYTD